MVNRRVFGTKEAAVYTQLSQATIRAYCEKKIFKSAYKEGRDWRIPKSDIDNPVFKNRKIGRPYTQKQ